MSSFIVSFGDVDKTKLNSVGGKGANLGELAKIGDIHVPEGFCISTGAYKRSIEGVYSLNDLLERLSVLTVDKRVEIGKLCSEIRSIIEQITIPQEINEEITRYVSQLGETASYAVRSSATAEDLPGASFAGQQDTYLNIIGKEAILKHVSKCWASLFTERAVIYRIQNGFDHRKVYLAVIVQKMVFPECAGIMFTADPVTSNRKILSIDASFGLGEALVSGIVNADVYKVREGSVIDKKISTKKLAIYAAKDGGTKEHTIESGQQNVQVLSDEQIVRLERIGRRIEKHFGKPQDIEWCFAADTFYMLQSRPVTTLFPVPVADDNENHVYVSVGHQQMMTDPIKPLGISVWRLTGPRQTYTAGGRLFVDVAAGLASPSGRQNLLDVLGHSDPLIRDALLTIIERGDFIKTEPPGDTAKNEQGPIKTHKGMSSADILAEAGTDAASGNYKVVAELMRNSEASLAALKQKIRVQSGPGVFECILEDMQQRRQHAVVMKTLNVIMAAIHASAWLNEKMSEWLNEKNVADTLTLSVPNNVTSEMGLALLDVADVIRPYPEIIEYLQQVKNDNFLDELVNMKGGTEVKNAIDEFLQKYGMRCAGEIDITRTRWSEKPAILIPMILGNVKNLAPGASKRKFEHGRQEALDKERDLLARLKQLPGGDEKATETKQMIDLVRNLIGYREYPKYDIVSRYFVYKQALLKEAERLVRAGILHEKEDIFYLSFDELQDVVRTNKPDYTAIAQRKEEYSRYDKLTPPRVITSDGEIITGRYNRENLPAGSVPGLAVSSGLVEGRARVIFNVEDAELENGDILVTPFTDPSWTPLFVSIKGLVTEVGGLMTHGAVIAREYGLPAVVGVENATKLIRDGQRIRVHGTDGYVELL